MKKWIALTLTLVLVCSAVLAGCSDNSDKTTLYVYNWQEYIAEGEDDSLDVIAAFEEKYPHINVEYSTYPDNETMYSKLSTGGITVDLIIPSDYMIACLREQDMLLPLNFDNIPNYANIDESFKNMAYDPENKYSVPYTWGTVGIIYNTKHVSAEDVTGWELLWNEKYAGKILMFGNSRDAFGIAQYRLGYDVNTTDETKLRACADLLKKQVPVLQQHVMDEVFSALENEEAWIAPYYAGDYLTMAENNPDLAFYLPEAQGFNLFVDAMCIPSCAQEKEAAELFINFLCDPEVSGKNLGYLGYSTPISAAKAYMDEEMANNPIAYPDQSVLAKGTSFAYLPDETARLVESLFMEVINN